MANNLTDRALPGTGADAGPIGAQGPEVDKPALETPPASPTAPTGGMGGPPSPKDMKEAIHKQAFVDTKLQQLLEEGGPVPRKDVVQVATEIVAERVMSAQAMAGYLADLPEDPDAIREWVKRHADAAEQSLQQMMVMLHGSEAPPTAQPMTSPTTPTGPSAAPMLQ